MITTKEGLCTFCKHIEALQGADSADWEEEDDDAGTADAPLGTVKPLPYHMFRAAVRDPAPRH